MRQHSVDLCNRAIVHCKERLHNFIEGQPMALDTSS